jgi:hypothetical protein
MRIFPTRILVATDGSEEAARRRTVFQPLGGSFANEKPPPLYSPECVEEKICELRPNGVLGSSYAPHLSNKRVCVCRMFALGEETRGRRLGRVARGTGGVVQRREGLEQAGTRRSGPHLCPSSLPHRCDAIAMHIAMQQSRS